MILPKQLRQELEEKRNTLVHLIHNERHQLAPKDRAIIKKYNQIVSKIVENHQKYTLYHAADNIFSMLLLILCTINR